MSDPPDSIPDGLYNKHGPNNRDCSRVGLNRIITVRIKPISFGRRRKLPEPYNLMALSHACSLGAVIIYHCPITTHLGGGEEVIVSFLCAPSL